MPVWASWLVVACAILCFFSWAKAYNAEGQAMTARKDVEELRREIRDVWSRCGHLEGYVDVMAKRIIESDPYPDVYDSATNAAKHWQAWRNEQMTQSQDR